jgi:hypothetical protein
MSGLPQEGEHLNSWLAATDGVEPTESRGKSGAVCLSPAPPALMLIGPESVALTPEKTNSPAEGKSSRTRSQSMPCGAEHSCSSAACET